MFLRFTFLGLSNLEKFKITLKQIIQTVKAQDNYSNKRLLSTSPLFLHGKKIPVWKLFFPIFSNATLQRINETPNQSNFWWLKKDRKWVERMKNNTSLRYTDKSFLACWHTWKMFGRGVGWASCISPFCHFLFVT